MRRTATFECADCGQTTTRTIRTGRPRVCLDCAIDRVVRSARAMHSRSGPEWDKWLTATARAKGGGF